MFKVTFKVKKLGKMDDIVKNHKFIVKLLQTTVFGEKAFWKIKVSSKDKCVTVKGKGGRGMRNCFSEKLILTQCLLLYHICNIQFNLSKTHF